MATGINYNMTAAQRLEANRAKNKTASNTVTNTAPKTTTSTKTNNNSSWTVGNGTTGSVGYTDTNQEIERTKSVLQYRQSQGMDTSAQQAWYKKLTGTDYTATPTVPKTNTTTPMVSNNTSNSNSLLSYLNNSNYSGEIPDNATSRKYAEWNAKNNPTHDPSKARYVYTGLVDYKGGKAQNYQYLMPGQTDEVQLINSGNHPTYDYGTLSDPEKWVNEGLEEGKDWWYNPVTHNAQLMSDFRNGTSQGTPTSLSDNRAPTFDFSSHSLDDLKKMLADSGYTPNYTPEQYAQYQQDFASQPYGKVFDPNKYNGSMVNREDYIYDALYRYLNNTWGGQV